MIFFGAIMDLQTVIIWIQIGIWVGALVRFIWKQVAKGSFSMKKIISSDLILLGLIVFGFLMSSCFLYLNYRSKERPDFKIKILSLDVSTMQDFVVPDGEKGWMVMKGDKELAGIVINLRIRNAGSSSIATDWELTIKTPERTLKAEPTGPPIQITMHGMKTGRTTILKQSDFSLENEVGNNPIKPGDRPIQGNLFFIVKMVREKVISPDTVIELTVNDFSGRTSFPAIMRIGDQIQWE